MEGSGFRRVCFVRCMWLARPSKHFTNAYLHKFCYPTYNSAYLDRVPLALHHADLLNHQECVSPGRLCLECWHATSVACVRSASAPQPYRAYGKRA